MNAAADWIIIMPIIYGDVLCNINDIAYWGIMPMLWKYHSGCWCFFYIYFIAVMVIVHFLVNWSVPSLWFRIALTAVLWILLFLNEICYCVCYSRLCILHAQYNCITWTYGGVILWSKDSVEDMSWSPKILLNSFVRRSHILTVTRCFNRDS